MNDTENKELDTAAENTEEKRAPAAEAPIELTLDPAAAEAVASAPSAEEPPAAEPAPEIPPAPAPVPAPATPAEPQPEPQPPAPQAPAPEPAPAPAWEKPTPQLTLDPDPELPVIEFNTEPPHAPEPPAEPQPPVQNQYYNYNAQNYNAQNRPYSQPYAPGYQPPNYTAQSYRPRPQQQPMYTTPPMGYQQKSRLAAGLLAFIFGVFGVHNFYMGFNGRGTVQLLLSLIGGVLTCGLGTVASAIWAFIEAVMILSSTGPRFDGNGVIMKD